MDIRKLQRAIVDGLEDVKAHDIRIYNTEHLSSEFERVIVASGTSNRQTKALAVSVRDAVKSRGLPVLSMEGEANGEWIIVDCGAAVAHVMQPAIRQYYNLEEIWGGKAVNMKLGGGLPSAAKAAASTTVDKAVAKRTPSKTAAAPKHQATAKRPAPKRSAANGGTAKRPATQAPSTPVKTARQGAKKTASKAPPRTSPNTSPRTPAKTSRTPAKTSPRTTATRTTTAATARRKPSRA